MCLYLFLALCVLGGVLGFSNSGGRDFPTEQRKEFPEGSVPLCPGLLRMWSQAVASSPSTGTLFKMQGVWGGWGA